VAWGLASGASGLASGAWGLASAVHSGHIVLDWCFFHLQWSYLLGSPHNLYARMRNFRDLQYTFRVGMQDTVCFQPLTYTFHSGNQNTTHLRALRRIRTLYFQMTFPSHDIANILTLLRHKFQFHPDGPCLSCYQLKSESHIAQKQDCFFDSRKTHACNDHGKGSLP
jgi:hypothetical protein